MFAWLCIFITQMKFQSTQVEVFSVKEVCDYVLDTSNVLLRTYCCVAQKFSKLIAVIKGSSVKRNTMRVPLGPNVLLL